MKLVDIQNFEKVEAQLKSIYEEMDVLSKKKPDDAINDFKLDLVNRIIELCNKILKDNKPIKDFNKFESGKMPSNSDVVVVLSQYISCLDKVRSENINCLRGNWYWVINDKISNIRSAPPKKINYNK